MTLKAGVSPSLPLPPAWNVDLTARAPAAILEHKMNYRREFTHKDGGTGQYIKDHRAATLATDSLPPDCFYIREKSC